MQWLMPVIPATWEVEIGRIMVLLRVFSPGKKTKQNFILTKKSGMVVHICNPNKMVGIGRRIVV
jgi:hypothetical protein